MWHMVGGEHSLQISAPQFLQFGIDSVLKILNERITDLIDLLITMAFVEPPRLDKVC